MGSGGGLGRWDWESDTTRKNQSRRSLCCLFSVDGPATKVRPSYFRTNLLERGSLARAGLEIHSRRVNKGGSFPVIRPNFMEGELPRKKGMELEGQGERASQE